MATPSRLQEIQTRQNHSSMVRTSGTPRSVAERDSLDERDGVGFEVRSSRFSECRTPNFGSRFSCMSPLHAPRSVAVVDFFSILLACQCLTDPHRKNIVSVWGELNAPREYGSSGDRALGWCASPA